jgi:hypothetical protein
MFRALLWKEWRELWILPAVAVPLGLMSFFITTAATHREMAALPGFELTLSPVVWDTTFGVWLLLAAIYIPTHLYAREKDLHTAEFLRTMPLDRFRLWWFRLLIGITVMAGVGLTLLAVIMILGAFQKTAPNFYGHAINTIVTTGCIALILFSLSSFFSSLFRRQLSAIAGIALTFVCFGAIFWALRKIDTMTTSVDLHLQPFSIVTLWGRYTFLRTGDALGIFMLILCPSLLFVSLAAFARGSMARQSRRRITITYAFLTIVALSPVMLGFQQFFAGVETSAREWSDDILSWHPSPDGQYIALQSVRSERSMKRNGPLLALDLSRRQINTLGDNLIFPNPKMSAHFPRTDSGEERVYVYRYFRNEPPNIFPFTIDVMKPDGSRKRNIFTGRWFDSDESRYQFDAHSSESADGRYLALSKKPSKKWKQDGYIKIMEASGKKLGTYPIPMIEEGETRLAGWDYASRLYFFTDVREPYRILTFNRMSVEHMIPEEVPNLPPEILINTFMYPGGRWFMLRTRSESKDGPNWWLYDIEKETYKFLGKNLSFPRSSPDGRLLAYSEYAWPEPRDKKLVLYDRQTGEGRSLLSDTDAGSGEHLSAGHMQWSPSGKYLFYGYRHYTEEDTGQGMVLSAYGPWEWRLLTVETGQTTAAAGPAELSRKDLIEVRWIAHDRLVWRNRHSAPSADVSVPKNVLIVTEKDGSNPEELFRVKDGKYYLYGKEQS